RAARTTFVFTRRVGGHIGATHAITFVNPDLNADDPIGCMGFGKAVFDVGAQRVQWHTAFAIPLGTGNLDSVQAPGTHDLDALGAQAHSVLHRALHGATEHNASLELLRA